MKTKENKGLNNSLKLIAKSSLIVLFGILLSKILTYAYRILIARYYTPEVYGLFALSIMVVGILTAVLSLGLDRGILRYLSYYKGKEDKQTSAYLFRTSLKILFFIGIISVLLLFFFSDFLALKIFNNPDLSIFLKIFSASILFELFSRIFLSSLQANYLVGWVSFISNILGNTTRLVIFLILIFSGIGTTSVPISYLAGSLSILLISFIVLKLREPYLFSKTKKNNSAFKELFSYSWPLMFFGFTLSILYWTDSFLLGVLVDVNSVGFYNAAVPIALLLTLSKDLFAYLFLPLVTEEYSKKNLESVKQLSKQVTKWIYLISLPLFMLLLVFPGVFIKLLFEEEYLVAINALRILSVGIFFVTMLDINKDLLSMKGKSKVILYCTIFAAILNIILNLVFIPLFSIDGAALATTISLVILSTLFFFFSYKELSIFPFRRKMINITLYSVLLVFGLLILRNFYYPTSIFSLLMIGAVLALLYFLAVFYGGCLDKNDKLIIEAVKRRLYF